jgi:hypothetical protein
MGRSSMCVGGRDDPGVICGERVVGMSAKFVRRSRRDHCAD